MIAFLTVYSTNCGAIIYHSYIEPQKKGTRTGSKSGEKENRKER